VITKLLVSGTIILGVAVGLAVPDGADPDFNNLTCSCRIRSRSPAHMSMIRFIRELAMLVTCQPFQASRRRRGDLFSGRERH